MPALDTAGFVDFGVAAGGRMVVKVAEQHMAGLVEIRIEVGGKTDRMMRSSGPAVDGIVLAVTRPVVAHECTDWEIDRTRKWHSGAVAIATTSMKTAVVAVVVVAACTPPAGALNREQAAQYHTCPTLRHPCSSDLQVPRAKGRLL